MEEIRLNKAIALLKENELFPAGSKVICCVSGGNDSMCLLHFLVAESRKQGFTVVAAHFNHQMRGERAKQDEEFVIEICRTYGVEVVCGRGDVIANAGRLGIGIEESGHRMRYEFFEEVASQTSADYIATAHHLDDNAETILLHMFRGAGSAGLSGIPPKRGKYVRPLITTSREQLEAYRKYHEIPCVFDDTNSDDYYARNYMRHKVMPLLARINSNASENIARAAEYIRNDDLFLNELALERVPLVIAEKRIQIPLINFQNAPEVLQARVVKHSLRELGQFDYRAVHLNDVIQLCKKGPSASVDLPGDLVARREYDTIVIEHVRGTELSAQRTLHIGDTVSFGEYVISCSEVLCAEESKRGIFFVDASQVSSELIVRSRAVGDTFCANVNGTRKTVKKLLIEKKTPKHVRDLLPVIADNNGVVALFPFGVDVKYQAKIGTKAIRIEIKGRDNYA